MRTPFLLLIILLESTLCVSGAYCARWQVEIDGDDTMGDGSPAAPFATIQRAVDSSASRDSIALGDGIHAGGVSIINLDLTLYSLSGDCMTCRIDGQGNEGIHYYARADEAHGVLRLENISVFNAEIGVSFSFGPFYHYEVGLVELVGCRIEGCVMGLGAVTCAVELEGCAFVGNSSSGVHAVNALVRTDHCVFRANGTGIIENETETTEIGRCIFSQTDFVANGVGLQGYFYGDAEFSACRIDSNQVGLNLANTGVYEAAATTIENCQIRDNTLDGIQLRNSHYVRILDQTEISGNGRHGIFFDHQDIRGLFLDRSLVARNGGDGIHWFPRVEGRNCTVWQSTIVGNAGHGLFASGGNFSLFRSLVVENGGFGIQLEGESEASVECTDIFANAGGDWEGPLEGMESQNGNLWTDPIFCDGPGGDYSLSGFSSCLPGSHPQGHACGLIGAFAQGCHAGQPAILSVLDVPDDQGGTIQLTWAASPLDLVPGWPSVTSYDLAREIPATLDWEILETRVAAGREFYEAFLPTLADSSDTWTETHRVLSTYKVVARTDDPSLFISSFPDSGYSVDNLAPDTPTDFAVTYREGSGYWLNWRQIPTPDLREFRVFRRMGGSAVPFSLMASTDQVQWHDNEATPGMAYQVAAVDQVGNQSPVSGVQSINFPPRASLLGVYPNPASSVATIVFELPRKAAVSLVVFDLKGQLVNRLVEDEEWTIGRHEFTWPGVDTEGRPVPSGRYFCRFQAEGVQETRGITLVH